jgi:hypothetical protein
MTDDPTINQTPAEIAEYYRQAGVGAKAAIRQTQYGLLRISITEIESINPKLGRLYLKQGAVDWGGSAYYRKTGKSCSKPTGQTKLVIPTKHVIAWAEANPDGLKIPPPKTQAKASPLKRMS